MHCSPGFTDEELEAEREMEGGRDRRAESDGETGMPACGSARVGSSWIGHTGGEGDLVWARPCMVGKKVGHSYSLIPMLSDLGR